MSTDTPKPDAPQPDKPIDDPRPTKPGEGTYGFPNRQDGIQSINTPSQDPPDPVEPNDRNTQLTGPGDTHSNGMKGQK